MTGNEVALFSIFPCNSQLAVQQVLDESPEKRVFFFSYLLDHIFSTRKRFESMLQGGMKKLFHHFFRSSSHIVIRYSLINSTHEFLIVRKTWWAIDFLLHPGQFL